MVNVILCSVMLFIGVMFHFLVKWKQIKKDTGVTVSPKEYWIKNPYHTGIVVLGAAAGFILAYTNGQLTPAIALGIGYMADNIPDSIGSRSIEKIKKDT